MRTHTLRNQSRSNKILVFSNLFIFFIIKLILPNSVSAICPVCTVAVGAGLGISQALGIDDAVTSVWIGGLILSMSFWMVDWMIKKDFKFTKGAIKEYLDIIVIVLMYTLVLVPLWYGKYIGREPNMIFGFDKILFGTLIGSGAFLLGKWLDKKVREIKGKQFFQFQKVIFPVTCLIIASVIMHFVVSSMH